MPSDPRIEVALEHLRPLIDAFRSTVVSTAEEVRGYLASRQSDERSASRNVAVGLGQFASGRIDYDRFAAFLTTDSPDDPATLARVEKAYDVLRTISAAETDLFHLRVKPGSRLREAVAGRLAQIGRGFAAARLAGQAQTGSLNSGSDDKLLAPLGFERWTGAERKLAPPLVIEVDGADLHGGDLIEFLDGSLKLVLVVHPPMSPAPLVRAITPSVVVLQTRDATGLERFVKAGGPAVAALVPSGAACFIHDPMRGLEIWERLEVLELPGSKPKAGLGGLSLWQQFEELEQLQALARRPEGQPAEAGATLATAPENPVDKLAAWLLSQADLKDLD